MNDARLKLDVSDVTCPYCSYTYHVRTVEFGKESERIVFKCHDRQYGCGAFFGIFAHLEVVVDQTCKIKFEEVE